MVQRALVTEGEAEMRVLIIGSGGREHALAWAIAKSPLLAKLYAAPGNPGTAEIAENVPLRTGDIAGIVKFAVDQKIDLVIPGPEAPLVAGIADALAARNIACCGPSAAAAQLEGSKKFTKDVADGAGNPHGALGELHPCAGGPRLYRGRRRADRHQGRWLGGGQGRRRRRHAGGGA